MKRSRQATYICCSKVNQPPQTELNGPQTSVLHFGWNTPDSRKYDERFRAMGLEIAQMWDAADGKLVDMSSDTLPGLPTQEQILELRAKGTMPTRQGGFGYLRGPDGALIENAQAGQVERFNHIHMYHEHPLCAMEWFVTHLGATIPPNPGNLANDGHVGGAYGCLPATASSHTLPPRGHRLPSFRVLSGVTPAPYSSMTSRFPSGLGRAAALSAHEGTLWTTGRSAFPI